MRIMNSGAGYLVVRVHNSDEGSVGGEKGGHVSRSHNTLQGGKGKGKGGGVGRRWGEGVGRKVRKGLGGGGGLKLVTEREGKREREGMGSIGKVGNAWIHMIVSAW